MARGEAAQLQQVGVRHMKPNPPYSISRTAFKPSHFPARNVMFEDNTWYSATMFEGEPVGVVMRDVGSVDCPSVECEIYMKDSPSDVFIQHLIQELEHRYDVNGDISKFEQLAVGDQWLAGPFERLKGMRPSTSGGLLEFLVITVVLQNATVRRSIQMMDNILDAYGTPVEFAGQVLTAFPSTETLSTASEESFRALKLGYRARTIHRLVASVDDRWAMSLRQQPADDQRTALLGLYGIGPASVGYLRFEVFHHYDALDNISPWERKIFARLLLGEEDVPVDTLQRLFSDRWPGWRMLAAHYLFEDLFWRWRTHGEDAWLGSMIRA